MSNVEKQEIWDLYQAGLSALEITKEFSDRYRLSEKEVWEVIYNMEDRNL